MVSAGDARNNGIVSVRERSNIVAMPFPSSGMVYSADAPSPEPAPNPDPAPVPTPTPPPIPSDVLSLLNTIRDEIILTKLQGAETASRVAEIQAKINTLPDSSQPITFPEYAGTVSIKVLNKETSARIVLKPQGGQ
jgi:hypothetical protein